MNLPIALASNSPRRLQLLEGAGFIVTRVSSDGDEDFPEDMPLAEVAPYLARKKMGRVEPQELIALTADTTVVFPDEILNKPGTEEEAVRMLKKLSGRSHKVVTGVCMRNPAGQIVSFSDTTEVWFRELDEALIAYYLQHGNPYDKAGGYGIQDSIGYLGIDRVHGCFYNVMGLPVRLVYENYLKLL